MADFVLTSLRGGLNNTDPPISLEADRCTVANNVEFFKSQLGERRRGADAIDITGSDLVGHDRVTFLHRHLPTGLAAESELWALGVTGTASSDLCKKGASTWTTITVADAITLTGGYQYRLHAVTFHGKLYLAYKSAVDRLHVWDGTTFRKTGLAEPAAPTAADTGGAGSLTGTRYYRVRFTVMSGATVLRRSEPSDALTFAPSGSNASITITKPATINESETHWELEASTDGSNFYVLATTVVGTTTVVDTTVFATGYASLTLSEDSGDYSLLSSAEFLVVDEDRLMLFGSFEVAEHGSRVQWTPVHGDVTGVGNAERVPIDTTNYLDLDVSDGGRITGAARPTMGSIYVFKEQGIYKLVRTGLREKAYEPVTITKDRGAIRGSVTASIDQNGDPCVDFTDPEIGPMRIGATGLQPCGADLRETWDTVNVDAASVAVRSMYYPASNQLHHWVATGDSDVPDLRMVAQVNHMQVTPDGTRRGWALWDGPSAAALCACLYAENIDADTTRSARLKPLIGVEGDGLIWQLDTGDDDNGTEYAARIVSRPFLPTGALDDFESKSGVLVAKAVADATLNVIIRGVGLAARVNQIETTAIAVDCSPADDEDFVIVGLDNLSLSEIRTLQVEFADSATPGARWELHHFALRPTLGQQAG